MTTIARAMGAVSILSGAALLTGLVCAGAQASEMNSKAEIEAAVGDKTYQGSMLDNGFSEYYDAKGNIRGKDYTGKWRAADGTMCFQYGDNAENCWQVKIDGPAMTMYKDGKIDGNGILVDGNPHNF